MGYYKKSKDYKLQNILVPPFINHSVRWTARAITYVTPWKIAINVAQKSKTIFPNVQNIIDTTACYGNETLAFNEIYNDQEIQFIACEWDTEHMKQCQMNIKQSNIKNISFFQGNSLRKIDEYSQNHESLKNTIILCDPNWGGPEYKKRNIIETLKLGDRTVQDLVINVHAGLWILKVPINFDVDSFLNCITEAIKDIETHVLVGKRPNGSACTIHIFLKRPMIQDNNNQQQ